MFGNELVMISLVAASEVVEGGRKSKQRGCGWGEVKVKLTHRLVGEVRVGEQDAEAFVAHGGCVC